MRDRSPIAFLSYVRSDDAHDSGKITRFRERLEGEVRMHTGKSFPIFQDRNDLAWGQHWAERIHKSLADVTFLIPVITPSFFESPACREEFNVFLLRESTLGLNSLILPVYYLTCDQMEPSYVGSDEIASTLRQRQWTDWRDFRFKSLENEDVAHSLSQLAATIKAAIKDLHEIMEKEAKAPADKSKPQHSKSRQRTQARLDSSIRSTALSPPLGLTGVQEARPVGASSEEFLNMKDKPRYYAYTKRFDEVINSRDLAKSSELISLYDKVSSHAKEISAPYTDEISELESKLSSINEKSISVTIAVDNSGSMRGRPIHHTAAWLLVLAETLERANIACQIFGYTTRAWKGGSAKILWDGEGRPKNPGRLNELRHIVYKRAEDSSAESGPSIAVMIREGILKENIDGESIAWAHAQAVEQIAESKVLLVLTDGAPVDDATIEANGAGYLVDHLHQVVEDIRNLDEAMLCAVGIGHDAARYFGKDTMNCLPEEVGIGALRTLVRVLTQ